MLNGIYKYTDLVTGDVVYVGKDSHIDKHSRHKDHLSPSKYDNQPFNRILQNNPDRYEYSVIWATEYCTPLKLNKMEILFGKIYNPKFNFGKFGKGGCNRHSDESKKKMSESHKGKILSEETKRKIGEGNKGKILSEKTKQKISENHVGMLGKKHSTETKLKMSKSRNTSGYFRVYKEKDKGCKQGFIWAYKYHDDKKLKIIRSVSIDKLEKKVKSKRLKWLKYEED